MLRPILHPTRPMLRCEFCGGTFWKRYGRREANRFCSRKCSRHWWSLAKTAERAAKADPQPPRLGICEACWSTPAETVCSCRAEICQSCRIDDGRCKRCETAGAIMARLRLPSATRAVPMPPRGYENVKVTKTKDGQNVLEAR